MLCFHKKITIGENTQIKKISIIVLRLCIRLNIRNKGVWE